MYNKVNVLCILFLRKSFINRQILYKRFINKIYSYMCDRFILLLKISTLSCRIKSMKKHIIIYKHDMKLKNDLYYCGRGDVDKYIDEWSNGVYWRISVYMRLMQRYERRLGGLSCGGCKFLKNF